MLSAALGLSHANSRPVDAIIAKVLRLSSDTRGWAEVIEELLATLSPSTPLRCKDKRVLEVVLSLAEAQLLPYPGPVRDVSNLLRATTRILERARGLYALLPKFSIDFLFRSFNGLLRGEPDTARLLAEMLAVCVAVVNLRDADGADDDKLERAARSHFHAEGGTASIFELLAASTVYEAAAAAGAAASRSALTTAAAAATNNPLDGLTDVVPLLALRVLEALLLVRPTNTEYAIVAAVLEQAARLAPVLLRLTDHGNERVRRVACAVLRAVLLECEPAQCAMLQHAAIDSAALLPLLACCFTGGEQIVRAAVPRPLHFAVEENAHDDAIAEPSDPGTPREAAVPPADKPAAGAAGDGQGSAQDGDEGDSSRALPLISQDDSGGSGVDDDEQHVGDDGKDTVAVAPPVATDAAASSTTASNAVAAMAASATASAAQARSEDLAVYRELVERLCDDCHSALSLLGRIAPRALVTRHLRRPRAMVGASDAAAVLATLEPAERARVRALSRAERERYCRAIRHNPLLPRGRWSLFWRALQSRHDEPLLLWRPECLSTLQAACAQEFADVRREAALAGEALDRMPPWEHRTFEVSYPQLADALYVAPLYIEPLLEVLRPHVPPPCAPPPTGAPAPPVVSSAERPAAQAAAQPSEAPPPPLPELPIAHAILLERLWQRASIETSAARQLTLLEALGAVHAVYGGTEPTLSCLPYLVSLLRPDAPPALPATGSEAVTSAPEAVHGLEPRVRVALRVLSHAAKHAQNVIALVEAGGVDELSTLLTRLPMHTSLAEAAQRSRAAPPRDAAAIDAAADGTGAGGGVASSDGVGRELEYAATLEADRYGSAEVRETACAMAIDVLELLQTIALSSRRAARTLCCSPHLERIAQALLSGAPLVIERCVELLSLLCDSLPSLTPWLHASGAFHFLLATLPIDGRTTLPVAAAQFLKRFHRRQQRTVLAHYLPLQLLSILNDGSPTQFAAALQADAELPTLLWNEKSRRLLISTVRHDLAPFCAQLLLARAAASVPPPHVRFRVAPSAPVQYGDVERELMVGGVLLRFFARHEGLAPVPHPDALDAQLVAALVALQPPPPGACAAEAEADVSVSTEVQAAAAATPAAGPPQPSVQAVAPTAATAATAAAAVALVGLAVAPDAAARTEAAQMAMLAGGRGGSAALHRALVLETARLLRQANGRVRRQPYAADGWLALLGSLAALRRLLPSAPAAPASATASAPRHPPHHSSGDEHLAQACAHAGRLLHFLLVECPPRPPRALRSIVEWTERAMQHSVREEEEREQGEAVEGTALPDAPGGAGTDDEDDARVAAHPAACVSVGGCSALLLALQPLLLATSAVMGSAAGFPASFAGFGGGVAAPSAELLGDEMWGYERQGAHGASALLIDGLGSLAVLMCHADGLEQLVHLTHHGLPACAPWLASVLLLPLEGTPRPAAAAADIAAGVSTPPQPALVARLRSWRHVCHSALRCLCVAADVPVLRDAMLESGVPLLLLRLCAARGSGAAALEHSRIALLAARLLGTLAGLRSATDSPSSPAPSEMGTGGDMVPAAAAAAVAAAPSAAVVRHLLRHLLPGVLSDSLRSPALFLKRLHSEWREPTLIWTASMAAALHATLADEICTIALAAEPATQLSGSDAVTAAGAGTADAAADDGDEAAPPVPSPWAWRHFSPPEYAALKEEPQLSGVFLSVYADPAAADGGANDRALPSLGQPPSAFLSKLLTALEQLSDRALHARDATRSARLKACALARLVTEHPAVLAHAAPLASVRAATLRLLSARDPAIMRAALTLGEAVVAPPCGELEATAALSSTPAPAVATATAATAAASEASGALDATLSFALQALPSLHLALHSRTATSEVREAALHLIAALIRLESAPTDRKRRRKRRADRTAETPGEPSGVGVGVAEAVLRGGVVLSCILHLVGYTAAPPSPTAGADEPAAPASTGSATGCAAASTAGASVGASSSYEVRVAAVDPLCALLLDNMVGAEAEELLERCLAPQFVDELAAISWVEIVDGLAGPSADADANGGSGNGGGGNVGGGGGGNGAAASDSTGSGSAGETGGIPKHAKVVTSRGQASATAAAAQVRARALLAQLDADHWTPVLIWHGERQAQLRATLDEEVRPIVELLRERAIRGDGLRTVTVGDVSWASAALIARLEADETDLKAGGLYLEPFVAADGLYSFPTAAAAGQFLTALLVALQDASYTLRIALPAAETGEEGRSDTQDDTSHDTSHEEVESAKGAMHVDGGSALSASSEGAAHVIRAGVPAARLLSATDEAMANRAARHIGVMWEALLLLLSSHASLGAHRACVAAIDFLFGAVRLPLPLTVHALELQVLGALSKPSAVEFVASVRGVHLLALVALGARMKPLAAGSLGLVFDLVRRSPPAVLSFFRLGGLVLLMRALFAPATLVDSNHGDAGAHVGSDASGARGDVPATSRDGAPSEASGGTGGAPGRAVAREGGGAPAEQPHEARLFAVRVLSALTSDSRHGAEIAASVCELLTPRFRMIFEAKPDAFLAFFDSDHTAGSSERGNVREWDAKRRAQLRALFEEESRHIMRAVDAAEAEARADDSVPLPAWVHSQGRVEQAWQPPEVVEL